MECNYKNICDNQGSCHKCNEKDQFILDETQFKCYNCEASMDSAGKSKCKFAFDLYNLNNKCKLVEEVK